MRIMIKGSLYSVEEIELCDNGVNVILSKIVRCFYVSLQVKPERILCDVCL